MGKRLLLSLIILMVVTLPLLSSCTETEQASTGGTLRIAITTEPDTLAGNPPSISVMYDLRYMRPVVESLISRDDTGAPKPWLAIDWDYDTEAKTITLDLREGVKFHDGTDFNAEAAKWNLDRYIATGKADVAYMDSVDVLGDYQIRINMKENDSKVIHVLSLYPGLMVSPTAWQNGGSTDEERDTWAEMHPVGTGPFKFVDYERSVKVTLAKFEDYWQEGKPYLDGMEFVVIADQFVASASLMAGEVDILFEPDGKTAKDLEATGDFVVSQTRYPSGSPHLNADTKNPESPYYDVKVRQAVEHAINKQEICDSIGMGYWQPMYQWSVEGSWAYNPDVEGYTFNPERAMELLDEAGYPADPETGIRFETKIMCISISPCPDVSAAIQSYLKDVGIDAEIEVQDPPKYLETQKTEWSYSNALNYGMYGVYPNDFVCHLRNFAPGAHEGRYPNMYVPEEYEVLCAEAIETATDEESMIDVAHRMQEVFNEYAITNWLYAQMTISAKSLKVHDDNIHTNHYDIWTPEDAWIEQ